VHATPTRALPIGSSMNGTIGTAAEKKSAPRIHSACCSGARVAAGAPSSASSSASMASASCCTARLLAGGALVAAGLRLEIGTRHHGYGGRGGSRGALLHAEDDRAGGGLEAVPESPGE
jgi:hypothetical protein